jgi:hypothetical protein
MNVSLKHTQRQRLYLLGRVGWMNWFIAMSMYCWSGVGVNVPVMINAVDASSCTADDTVDAIPSTTAAITVNTAVPTGRATRAAVCRRSLTGSTERIVPDEFRSRSKTANELPRGNGWLRQRVGPQLPNGLILAKRASAWSNSPAAQRH